jgi:hypothetical protein
METINDCVLVKDETSLNRKPEVRKHLTTKERIMAFCKEANMDWDKQLEVNWGKPAGKEVW